MGAQQEQGSALRTDIQGLRALAVALVVVFHLHGPALPGGFVGVDVFFVISGFLITSHLVGRPPTGARDLAAFWGRRIRRLLPASLLVLAATLVAVRLFSPETVWDATASDARAAALYVVNWALAGQAVDYLAADNAPTAVQHFWSLSVEEQFYFGWPLLVAAVVLLTRRRRISTRVALGASFAVVTAASLAWSIHLTATNPAAAYFVTPTRIWELAAGGLLAVVVAGRDAHDAGKRRGEPGVGHRSWRLAGTWAGVAMITASAILYSGSTPFPGYQAALPVLGTVLLLGCGAPREDRLSPGPVLALRPVQWLGDVSYSVYLWHWPIIVVTTSWLGHELGWRSGAIVLALTLVLAGLTERFVERPFRTAGAARSLGRTYGVAVAAMAVVVGLATLQLVEVERRADRSEEDIAAALRDGGPCFGAAAIGNPDCPEVAYDDLVPSALAAPADRPDAEGDVETGFCRTGESQFGNVTCYFGERDADVRISLFGNSHAGQWMPTLRRLAESNDWELETNIASRCAPIDVEQQFTRAASAENCLAWVDRITESIVSSRPDLVVFTNKMQAPVVGQDLAGSEDAYVEGYQRILRRILDAGVPVLAIRDTPEPGRDIPSCIAENPDRLSACDGTRARWLPPDPVIDAVQAIDDPRLDLVDLTDRFCEARRCRAVNGGVITYFDTNHITKTYAQTLAPYLEPHVLDALGR